jgi:hypothetical protein
MRTSKLAGAALAAAALTLLPAAAATAGGDVQAPGALKVVDTITQKRIDSAANKSGLDVYLPDTLATGSTKPSKIKGSSLVSEGNYTLDLGVGKNCGGATACFVAEFIGIAGEKPHYTKKVKLRGGKTGYYKPLTCGASCSPPAIEWRVGKVLYGIQFNTQRSGGSAQRADLVKLANQALAAGARNGGELGQL